MAKATTSSASTRKKARRNVTVGVAHIQATFNNTIITVTDTKGEVLCWASAGTCGFKGSRKSTPFAGQMSAQQVAEKAVKYGMKEGRRKGEGAGQRARERDHGVAGSRTEDQVDRGRDSVAAQRLPSEEAPPRIVLLYPQAFPATAHRG